MAQALASLPSGSTGRWLTSFHHFQGVPSERAENLSVWRSSEYTVAKYFQEESKSGNKPQFRAGAVIAKIAAATGVGKNSVRKIVSAGKVIDEGKTRKAKVRFGKLDNFDVGVIRRIIHNLYRENISPNLKKILLQLKEKMNFPYGKTFMAIVKENGVWL